MIRTSSERGRHYVDFNEHRFITRNRQGPAPFSYRVVFNDAGDPIEEGWQVDGMDVRRLIKIAPTRTGNVQ